MFRPPPLQATLPLNADYPIPGITCIHVSDDGLGMAYLGPDCHAYETDIFIKDRTNSYSMPAVIGLDAASGKLLLGYETKNDHRDDKQIRGLCRIIGRSYEDLSQSHDARHLNLERGEDGSVRLRLGAGSMAPEEWLAMLLRRTKTIMEKHLGRSVDQVVLTHSASMGFLQQKALVSAAQLAGLNPIRLLRHSVAAAMGTAWHFRPSRGFSQLKDIVTRGPKTDGQPFNDYVAITYTGSECTEITLVEISEEIVEVCAVRSDSSCGIHDLDRVLAEYFLQVAAAESSEKDTLTGDEWSQILSAAAKAREALIYGSEVSIKLPHIQDSSFVLTRDEWLQIIGPVIDGIDALWASTLDDAGFKTDEIVAMMGLGATNIVPTLFAAHHKRFGEASARGRGLCPDDDGYIMRGAVAMSGILSGWVSELLLLDTTHFTLSMRVAPPAEISAAGKQPYLHPLVLENTTIPVTHTCALTTQRPEQDEVVLDLFEDGEGRREFLGSVHLDALPTNGTERPEVTCTVSVGSSLDYRISISHGPTNRSLTARIPIAGQRVLDSSLLAAIPVTDEEKPCSADADEDSPLSAEELDALVDALTTLLRS